MENQSLQGGLGGWADPDDWSPGQSGKGFVYDDGGVRTWNVPDGENPHHADVLGDDVFGQGKCIYITPDGYVDCWDALTSFVTYIV